MKSREEAEAIYNRYLSADVHWHCIYGHRGCSPVRGGACVDEAIAALAELVRAEDLERALGVTAVLDRASGGVTERSKQAFLGHMREVEFQVERVALAYVTDPAWDFLVYLIDAGGRALVYDGFSWGYGGEGPAGLRWLLGRVGWDPNAAQPTAHTPGAWLVHRDGRLERVR